MQSDYDQCFSRPTGRAQNKVLYIILLPSTCNTTFMKGGWGDSKHTKPYIPTQLLKIKSDHLQPQGWLPYLFLAWCIICKHRIQYGHTWQQASLLRQGVIKQHKLYDGNFHIYFILINNSTIKSHWLSTVTVDHGNLLITVLWASTCQRSGLDSTAYYPKDIIHFLWASTCPRGGPLTTTQKH